MLKRALNSTWLIIAYWFKIWRESITTPARLIEANILMGCILLIGWLLASWFASQGIIDRAMPTAYQSQIYNVIRIVGAAIVAILPFLFFGSIYLPVKHYKKMGGFIKNPFEITPLPSDENYSINDVKWASIRVYNKSSTDEIERCFLKLTGICGDGEEPRKFNPQNLSWSGREDKNRNQVLPVHCLDERWCDIAMTMPNEAEDTATFTVWFGEGHQSMRINAGKYHLTIEAHGVWQSIPIVYAYSVTLNFESKLKLNIENVGEIRDRGGKGLANRA